MKTQKRRRRDKIRREPPPEDSFSQTSILDLPEVILTHHILSRLPTTPAAQTSAVTPAWRNLWHSVPVLDFDMRSFHLNKAPGKSVRYARQLFAEMLSQSLLQRPRHFAVEKFKVFFAYRNYGHIQRYVNSCLRFVIGAKAVELDLNFDTGFYFRPSVPGNQEEAENEEEDSDEEEIDEEDDELFSHYEFHYSDLLNSSVAVVKLRGIDLSMPPTEALSIKIYSLRELYLEESFCTDKEIEHLLASCVNLEILSLEGVEFMEDWKVDSKSLKHFTFKSANDYEAMENSVEICAPNLESLSLSDAYDGVYSLKDAFSLVAADVEFSDRSQRDFACWTNLVRSLGGVERLTMQNMWSLSDRNKKNPQGQSNENLAKFQPVEEVFAETFVFHNLKHVELFTGYSEDDIRGLEILLKKCPQLETMALIQRYKSSATLKKLKRMSVVLQMRCLRLVEMKEFQKTKSELFVVGLLKKHGVVLDKIVAHPREVYGEEPSPSFVL